MVTIIHITPLLTLPVRWGVRRLRATIREAAWHIVHDRATHRGIALRLHFKAPIDARGRIEDALDRIAEADPISFTHIPRLLPGGIIADATNYAGAWYSIPRKACVIGEAALRTYPIDELALCIIHEMCHARLWERGIGYDEPTLRVRVEEVCIWRQIAFARKLEARDVPPGFHTDWLAEKLSELKACDYTETHFQSRQRQQALQRLRLLRETKGPRWLRRMAVLATRRRLRAQRAQT